MGKTEEIKEKFAYFRKRRMKHFDYDTGFYTFWLLLSMCIWLILLIIENVFATGESFHSLERLFWWLWFIISLFIWQQRNSNLVFRHNMQVIDANFRELFDARVNVSVIKELIELKKKKCCGGKNCKTSKK